MLENVITMLIMELVMIAPYWLITALAVYMFKDSHQNKAGKHVVDCIWPRYICYNSFVSVGLAATGCMSKGFFAGFPEMRIVLLACIFGYIAYSIVLYKDYKRVSERYQQRATTHIG